MIPQGLVSIIGNTPMVELQKYAPQADCRLYAKLEGVSPGGSAKDRPAMHMIRTALADGTIDGDTVVLESSSGNMGIGMAQACAYFGLRFICIVDVRTAVQNVRILRAYGAEVDVVTEPDPDTGEYIGPRLRRLREIQASLPRTYWPDQHSNPANPGSHYYSTMAEIAGALEGRVDYVFVGTSTCGTVRGCSDYIRDHGMRTQVVAVDAFGSAIFGGPRASRKVPGLGAGSRPKLWTPDMADHVVHVTDVDCVSGCRKLVRREGLLVGGSGGGVLSAFERMQDRIAPGANCVAILCDRGERYLDTIYCDEWVRHQLGDVAHLWENQHAESYV